MSNVNENEWTDEGKINMRAGGVAHLDLCLHCEWLECNKGDKNLNYRLLKE